VLQYLEKKIKKSSLQPPILTTDVLAEFLMDVPYN
jgi:hypothetical protein